MPRVTLSNDSRLPQKNAIWIEDSCSYTGAEGACSTSSCTVESLKGVSLDSGVVPSSTSRVDDRLGPAACFNRCRSRRFFLHSYPDGATQFWGGTNLDHATLEHRYRCVAHAGAGGELRCACAHSVCCTSSSAEYVGPAPSVSHVAPAPAVYAPPNPVVNSWFQRHQSVAPRQR